MKAKGEKVGTLYLCTGNTDSSISLASTRVDTTLWHHRLGHMSEKVLYTPTTLREGGE